MPHRSTILIVDDEVGNRKTLEGILRPCGYRIVSASNGREALDQATTLTPDLVLLDIMMPVIDGIEVCRQLRANTDLAEIPVIMVTALDDRNSRLQGIEAGADDFLSKPYDRTELRMRVQTMMRLNRYRRLLIERAKFSWVVDHANDGFVVIGLSGQIRYANTQARTLLRLDGDPSTFIGQSFHEIVDQHYVCEPQQEWADWPQSVAESNNKVCYLVRPESASASACWIGVSALQLPTDAHDEWLVQLRDVSAQMVMRNDIWKFQSMVYHKLRTPLMPLLGLELLAEHASSMNPDEIAEIATLALQGAQRLQGAINSVLSYINIPSRAASQEGLLIDDLPALIRDNAAELDIVYITIACADTLLGQRLVLTEQTFKLVLEKILENTRKFHPIHRPRVEVQVAPGPNHMVNIQIANDGITLSPQQIADAWTPYYQGEKQFTGEIDGMGLGLARVATIIWAVGGTCRIANRPQRPGVMVELGVPAIH